jgi:hypothetical protein
MGGDTQVLFWGLTVLMRHYCELHGKPIFAPTDSLHHPDPEALGWHNEHAFRG